jgi:hypothetical protein
MLSRIGTVRIKNGVINAVGGEGTAGIGGANVVSEAKPAINTLIIEGGTVNAVAGSATGVGSPPQQLAGSAIGGGPINYVLEGYIAITSVLITGGHLNLTGAVGIGGSPVPMVNSLTIQGPSAVQIECMSTGDGVVWPNSGVPLQCLLPNQVQFSSPNLAVFSKRTNVAFIGDVTRSFSSPIMISVQYPFTVTDATFEPYLSGSSPTTQLFLADLYSLLQSGLYDFTVRGDDNTEFTVRYDANRAKSLLFVGLATGGDYYVTFTNVADHSGGQLCPEGKTKFSVPNGERLFVSSVSACETFTAIAEATDDFTADLRSYMFPRRLFKISLFTVWLCL